MSIAPPSDVVFDVAQAADPQKVRAATAKLVRLGAGTAADGADFEAQLASAGGTSARPAAFSATPFAATAGIMTRKETPYQKFEAMMLQNFIQAILPKDNDLFGDATSADAYRSMLSDQLASQLAKTGRLGIAHAIEVAETARLSAVGSSPDRASAAPAAIGAAPIRTQT